MNRLSHLERTLRANLLDNGEYRNAEYVVLNYNSKDQIDNWIESEMMEYIKCRKLVYIKTMEPAYFRMAHAKNMVTNFASGDIVCNIDADNFTGRGFASYVNERFNDNVNIFLAGGEDGYTDLTGRICLWKSDFLRIRGYDEKILDYGYEDTDVYSRLKKLGRTEEKIIDTKYLRSIPHDNYERMINGRYYSEIEFALTFELNAVIEAYILKVNHEFEHLIIVPSDNNEGLAIDVGKYCVGKWSINGSVIECKDSFSGNLIVLQTNDEGQTYSTSKILFKRIPKIEACLYYSLLKGQMVFRENIKIDSQVNDRGFGKGLFYEVFPA